VAPLGGDLDKSILVVTEGLGPQKFHSRVAILVNEHTASAGEMLAAFAEENGLATIVGTKTAARLLSGSTLRLVRATSWDCRPLRISRGREN
jgi:C-terminal processing protease CtpA/Prc